MSRWDALKPDNTSYRSSKRQDYATKNRNERNRFVFQRNEASKVDAMWALQAQCMASNGSEQALVSLAKSLGDVLDQIPATRVAESIVSDIFLKKPDMSPSCQMSVLQAIQTLLQSPNHASAMLAPLVEDVSPEGKEQLRVNPIRIQLFQMLQQKLLLQDDDLANASCETLTRALQISFKMEQTRRHANSLALDAEPASLQLCLMKRLPRPETRFGGLELLQTYLKRHPYCAPSLAMPLLDSYRQLTKSSCRQCGYAGTSLLLDCLHEGADAACASDCLVLLLRNLPLELWLSTPDNNPGKFRSTLDFYGRVSNVLEYVAGVTLCLLKDQGNRASQVNSLIKCLLMNLPFQHSKRVLDAAIGIVQLLFDWVGGEAPQQAVALDCLVHAAGGTETPQGDLVPMSAPLRHWLDSMHGKVFLTQCLSRLPQNSSIKEFQLIGALLRSHPALVDADQKTAQAFLSCVATIFDEDSADVSCQVPCMEMVHGLLKGRLDCPAEAKLTFLEVSVLQPYLLGAVVTTENHARKLACAAYGCLLPSDWQDLLQNGPDCIAPFQTVLSVGLDTKQSKIKPDAWKALGEMCAHFFDPLIRVYSLAMEDVLRLLAPSFGRIMVEPTDPAVRAMALLAMGNLAKALKDPQLSPVLRELHLHEWIELACRELSVSDDRVVSNAIRVLAQLYGLSCRHGTQNHRFKEVIEYLGQRVGASLDTKSHPNQALSWKERASIKKLACGASNALKIIFDSGVETALDLSKAIHHCLISLITCVEQPNRVPEKVLCCVIGALCAVNFQRVPCCADDVQERGLVTCIEILFKPSFDDDSHSKVHQELELLLEHLMIQCSSSELTSAFDALAGSTAELNLLFQWMVLRSLPSDSFSKVVSALMQSTMVYDIEVEQNFARRASAFVSYEVDDEL